MLPVPDIDRFIDSSVPKEIEISIQNFLLKVESCPHSLELFSLALLCKISISRMAVRPFSMMKLLVMLQQLITVQTTNPTGKVYSRFSNYHQLA